MDIQTRDGILLRGIPDGTPEEVIRARIEKVRSERNFAEIKAEGNAVRPPPQFTPSGEKPELSYSNPDILRGHPLVRFAEGAASPVIGVAQLGANVIGAGGQVNEFIAGSEQQAQEARRQLGSEGVDFWKLGGTVVSPAVLAAMKISPAGTVLGRAGQGAAVGAAFGAASPVSDASDYWMKKIGQVATGTAIGGVVPPAIDLTRTGLRLGRNIIDPMLPGGAERGAGRILAEAAGPKRAAIEAELARTQSLVSGSQPTAAEAAVRAGSPEFSALQKIAAEHRPSVYNDIAKAQEAARLAAIRGVGGTPAELEAAQAIRSASAAQNYGRAFETTIKADPTLAQLSKNPFFKEAIPDAVRLAKAKGVNPKEEMTEFLHFIKLSLDKQLTKTGDTALSRTEQNAVQNVKKLLAGWMSEKNPAYERARQIFENQSRPINEMQVGQELEKALIKPIGEGERAGVFATAMREAPRTIKKATGQPRFESLEDVLKPGNLSQVKNVLADLARKAELERLAPLGRAKAGQIAQPFGLPATGPLQQEYMIFKTILGRVSKGINEKTLDTMADALQLPSTTLKLLQKVPTDQQSKVIDSIISAKLGRGAIAASASLSGEGINEVQ